MKSHNEASLYVLYLKLHSISIIGLSRACTQERKADAVGVAVSARSDLRIFHTETHLEMYNVTMVKRKNSAERLSS